MRNTESSEEENGHILLRTKFQIISWLALKTDSSDFFYSEGLASEFVPAVGTVTGMLINVVQRTQTSVKWNTSQYIKKKKLKTLKKKKCNGNIYFLLESKSHSLLL